MFVYNYWIIFVIHINEHELINNNNKNKKISGPVKLTTNFMLLSF